MTLFTQTRPSGASRAMGWALAGTLAVLLAGCNPFGQVTDETNRWVQQYATATSLDPVQAQQKLAELAEQAPNEEMRRDAKFDRARMAVDAGQPDVAAQRYRALWDERDDDPVASRARYELGRLYAEHYRDHEQARRLLSETITETPPWAGSEMALEFLVRHELQLQRQEPLIEELKQLAERTDDERMAAQIHLQRGLVLEQHLDRPDDALQALRAAWDRCEDCASTDEAIYQMGKIYKRHQQWEPAASAFELIADRFERSWFVGTYSSHRASDSLYMAGRIQMLYRNDYEAATEHFETFLRRYDEHSDRHRVAWYLVNIERLAGDEQSHRRALEQFVDDYPDSRFVDDAEAQLDDLS